MDSIPRLSWLNAKQSTHSSGSRKNKPGLKHEHTEAIRIAPTPPQKKESDEQAS